MKKSRILPFAVLCLALGTSLAIYTLFLSPSALKARVKRALERHLAADIMLGAAQISPMSGLTLEGLRVRKEAGAKPLFKARSIVIRPDWLSLLRLAFRIKELRLQDAALTMKKDSSGRWNWDGVLKETIGPGGGEPPVLELRNCKLTIGENTYKGINCELTSFPTRYLIAIRGTWNDPFWGDYLLRGNINTRKGTLRVALESDAVEVTKPWVVHFPFVGKKVWERYRPEGLFGFTGNITLCWKEGCKTDYNLIYTARDSSCKWLVFPVTNATGRLIVDPTAVIINHLEGTLFSGDVEGYSIVNLKAPFTFYSRYNFADVDMAEFLKDFQTESNPLGGLGNGYVAFHGDHSLGTFGGRGELDVPDARLWKFPIILKILSKLQPSLNREEPRQDCRIVFTFTREGLTFEEISLVSDVFDIYGVGTSDWAGNVRLTFYVRPVSKTPLLIADALLQPALDSLSGSVAQFEITGTLREPRLAVIPLAAVSDQIVTFFDTLTRRRMKHPRGGR